VLVDFYHLAASPLERVLPSICEKVLASGERLLLVADEGRLTQLDELLWTYSKDSFLPHGHRSRANPEAQPILLSDATEPLNAATNIALADGRWRDEALAFRRTFYFFDASHVDAARGTWRALKGREGLESRYWKQDERGKWFQSA
jgi:DNA polymerase-3 subunit chi